MKSAIYLGKEKIEIREVPMPSIGDDDVLIKNVYSSICGTDVAVYKHGPNTGHRIEVGKEFGHETTSVVTAVGKNVTDFTVGERVYPYPLYATGDTSRAGTIGGFSEYIKVPHAKRNHSLYGIDDAIPDRMACLIEPFTVGCRAARRGQPKKGEKFVVFGCGTIGLACAIALKHFGVEQVMICDLSNLRLNIAKELGFATCNVATEDFLEKATAYFKTAPSLNGPVPDIDGFVDASGAKDILDFFMKHGKIESRFVCVAVNKSLRDIDLLHLTYAQKSIIGSGGYMPEDVKDVMEIMKSGAFDIEKIITHEFSLDDLDRALSIAGKPEETFNAIIKF